MCVSTNCLSRLTSIAGKRLNDFNQFRTFRLSDTWEVLKKFDISLFDIKLGLSTSMIYIVTNIFYYRISSENKNKIQLWKLTITASTFLVSRGLGGDRSLWDKWFSIIFIFVFCCCHFGKFTIRWQFLLIITSNLISSFSFQEICSSFWINALALYQPL